MVSGGCSPAIQRARLLQSNSKGITRHGNQIILNAVGAAIKDEREGACKAKSAREDIDGAI